MENATIYVSIMPRGRGEWNLTKIVLRVIKTDSLSTRNITHAAPLTWIT